MNCHFHCCRWPGNTRSQEPRASSAMLLTCYSGMFRFQHQKAQNSVLGLKSFHLHIALGNFMYLQGLIRVVSFGFGYWLWAKSGNKLLPVPESVMCKCQNLWGHYHDYDVHGLYLSAATVSNPAVIKNSSWMSCPSIRHCTGRNKQTGIE